jgi:Tfp pilus assembly protein PilV
MRDRTGRSYDQAGFGLIEVVVALALLLAIALPMSYLLGSVLQQAGDTKASIAAGLIAEQELEQAHSVLSAAMTAGASSICTPNGGTGPDLPCTIPQGDVQVQNFNYSISLYFQWADISGSADVCTSGKIPQVVLAQVTVSWGPTLRSVSQSSVVNLSYIGTNPLNGFLAVQVNAADGTGSQGVLVTATNSAASYSNSGLTDSHGCAFLTVPAATPGYTVALSPPSGGGVYVDENNNPAPSLASQGVSTQGITTVQFNYDQAATVDLTYPSVTGVADGVTCPTTTFCLASGQQQQTSTSGSNQTNGTPTAEILKTTDGASWNPVTVPGMARLLGISCASNTQCEAVGTGTTGRAVAVGVTISGATWTITPQTLPSGTTVAELSSVACTSTLSCFAVGYGVTGSTRAGVMLSWNGLAWAVVPTSGVEQIQSIACPSVLACVITDNNTAAPVPAPQLQTFTTLTNQFSLPITLSPVASTLTQVTCGSSVSGLCIAEGTSGGNAEVYISTGGSGTWSAVSGIPAGASTLGTPICPTTSSCILTDNTPSTSTATVLDLTGTTVGSTTTWAAGNAPTFPTGIQSLSDLACTTTSCVASGQASGTPAQGVLITSTTTAGTSWSTTAVPGSTTSTFLSGAGCFGSTCVSAGESPTGDLLYGTSGGTWQADTVPTPTAGVTGLLGAGFSAAIGNTTLAPNPFKEVVAAGTSPTTSTPNPEVLTPLFPFISGDTVWPGGCLAEHIPSPTTPPLAALTPGGTSSITAQLASLSLEIVDGSGQPVPGATVTLGVVSSSTMATLKCPVETFAMPTTSADGLSRAGFTYTDPAGSYTLTVVNPLDGKTTTTTITIGASNVTLASTTYPEPDPVIVAVQ